MKNLLLLSTLLFAFSCSSEKKVKCPEQHPVSSQALCSEVVVALCDKAVTCYNGSSNDDGLKSMCEMNNLPLCGGFLDFSADKREAVYNSCVPALLAQECVEGQNVGLPEECLVLLKKEESDAGVE